MSTASTYTISDYLLDRLAELGIEHVFGVPGDYTLGLLDHVVRHRRLSWVGCRNELNAGYAADGYGRMRGAAALMTTFGVGELSAINAVTGSFAEHVPVIHVVGAPSSTNQSAHRIVHHSLGDGVFTHFLGMHADITCAQAALTAAAAEGEIDRVLVHVRDEHLPGYLLLPADVAEVAATPPGTPLPPPTDPTDPLALEAFAAAAARLMDTEGLEALTVLAGLLVHRLGPRTVANLYRLLDDGGLRHATTLWGKSLVDESNPRYLGIYAGAASEPAVQSAVEDASVLVVAGVQFTDLNSGLFTQHIPRMRTIELGVAIASVGAATFAPVSMGAALERLDRLVSERRGAVAADVAIRPVGSESEDEGTTPEMALSQVALWNGVARHLRAGDIVLADQGTAFYGMATHRLPQNVTFLGQPLWASIGYTLPAALGACLAQRGRRGVVLIGDGAAQMTVQELSTQFQLDVPLLVVVVDNDGYTVERAIHGPEERYNDVPRWDWTLLPALLAPGRQVHTCRAETVGELEDALWHADTHPTGATLIQACVPRLDVPELLATLTRSLSGANAPRS
ncbi:MAG: alpha-keto acid decarboxylase family protein [Chloroflexi bacterium]|nr:alpha-keto acid decarboxylase family protein [Chloroflexota bacterium]